MRAEVFCKMIGLPCNSHLHRQQKMCERKGDFGFAVCHKIFGDRRILHLGAGWIGPELL